MDKATEIAAQVWCDPRCADIEMDVRLAQVFAERLRDIFDWLDNNTTHYLTAESDKPVLASVSEKIWYHATDDYAQLCSGAGGDYQVE